MIKLNNKEISALKSLLSSKIDLGKDKEVLTDLYTRLNTNGSMELFIDGASNLQKKTSGLGGVFYLNGDEVYSFAEYRPNLTNNEAEYGALIFGLEKASELSINELTIYSDSELVVRQILGEYQVKNPRMKELYQQAIALLDQLDSWSIKHVRREKNTRADALSKEGLSNSKS